MYCRMCFYCKLWLLAITTVPHILVKHVLCSEYVRISFFCLWLYDCVRLYVLEYAHLHWYMIVKTAALIQGIPLLKLCTSTIIYIYNKCESSGNFFSLINWCNNINVIIRILVLSVCVHCCFLNCKSVYIILSFKCI